MARKPGRQCSGYGTRLHRCANVVQGKDRYCQECSELYEQEQRRRNRQYDQERDQGKERRFIHSRQWQKIRMMKLAQDPLCQRCLEAGRETIAVLVHHADKNELNISEENLISVCNECHEEIHRHDRWRK